MSKIGSPSKRNGVDDDGGFMKVKTMKKTKAKRFPLSFFKKEIVRLDPNVKKGSGSFKTALFMLASLQEGPDVGKLAKFTKLPKSYIEPRVENLRKCGVWTSDGKIAIDWFDKEGGTVAFWCDTLVADGLIERKDVPAKKKVKEA